jgi:GntR family transcriptional regulator, transcriptional repressor for pyruvate dehydrogenase complex
MDRLTATTLQRPQKAAVILANTLVNIMFSENYSVGDRLPTEAELLETFDVGRGTLREALRLLETQGLISIGQGRSGGPVIRMPSYDSLARHMANAYCAHSATLGQLLDARTGVEPLVAAEAARNRQGEHLEALKESVTRMGDSTNGKDAFLEENSSFHQLIAEATGNPVYITTVASLKAVHDGHSAGVGFSPRSLAAAQRRHQNIYEKVANGDPEGAYEEMSQHMQEFRDFIRQRWPHILTKRIAPLPI